MRPLPGEPSPRAGSPDTLRGAGERVRRALAAGRRLALLHLQTLPPGATLADAIESLRRRTYADRVRALPPEPE